MGTVLFAFVAATTMWWGFSESQQNERLKAQADASGVELAQAHAALLQASKQDLPILVSFRHALLGPGLVAVFKNNSAQQLKVVALVSSQTQRKRFDLIVPANGIQEIGRSEGWRFAAGHRIKLSNTTFRPAEYSVPTQ